ncbi:MAG: hypothetical protein HY657_09750 [Acidobacteria bacterium]|nr:hypothetical protein [Acidobacteriota bacterium]
MFSLALTCQAGFSTGETAAVITATSILSATAAPQLQEYIETARATKATGDVRVIALSIIRLMAHVGRVGGHQRERPSLLVSAGGVPAAASPDHASWTLPLDGRVVQALEAHLVDNAASYAVGAAQPLRWRGPYLEGLSSDPWGSRYAANVGLLGGTRGQVVIVLSPGPNGIVETPFEMVGLRLGGDDVAGLIASGW